MRGRPEAQAREGGGVAWVGPTGCSAPFAFGFECACASRGSGTYLEPGETCSFLCVGKR